jgi:taurine dioxygenase
MKLDTRPLHPRFGAEVIGLRIDRILDDAETLDALHRLWQEAAVLVFRRQSLTEDELVRFSSSFGECEVVSRKDILSPYTPEVIYFSTLRYADGRTVGGFAGGEEVDWHSDQTFRPFPSTGAMIYGVEVPRDGGAMHWANQYMAWDLLPAEVREAIDGRTGIYRYAKRLEIMNMTELRDKIEEMKQAFPEVRHPVVLTHPRTGRKALYADPTTLVEIEGLGAQDNARILPQLFAAGGDASTVCSHTVANGDVLMWDNGCLMHRRDPVSIEQPRLMKRTTFRVPATEHCVPH